VYPWRALGYSRRRKPHAVQLTDAITGIYGVFFVPSLPFFSIRPDLLIWNSREGPFREKKGKSAGGRCSAAYASVICDLLVVQIAGTAIVPTAPAKHIGVVCRASRFPGKICKYTSAGTGPPGITKDDMGRSLIQLSCGLHGSQTARIFLVWPEAPRSVFLSGILTFRSYISAWHGNFRHPVVVAYTIWKSRSRKRQGEIPPYRLFP